MPVLLAQLTPLLADKLESALMERVMDALSEMFPDIEPKPDEEAKPANEGTDSKPNFIDEVKEDLAAKPDDVDKELGDMEEELKE